MFVKMYSFLLAAVLFRLVGAPHSETVQVIRELNHVFQTELNVFIDFDDLYSSNILKNLDTPRILLSSKLREPRDFQIRGNFTERAIVIVRLMEFGLDPKVASLLPHLMDKLHELHTVFMSMEEPAFLKQELYTYCFKEGLINVILLNGKDLYSYLPYPSVQSITLANISQYMDRGRIIRNFQGYPVRILRSTLAPRDFEYFNDQGELVRSGYLFLAVKELTNRYNATLESVPMPDLPDYELYLAVTEMLVTKKIDIVCYFKDTGWGGMAYTDPLSILNMYFMVPHARPISSYLYYSKPFSWPLWLVVISTVVYGTLMLRLTSAGARIDIGECFLYSLSHMLYNSHQNIRTACWRDVVIHAILTIGGFIITNIYLASLSSILTSGLYEEEYNTLEDLAKAPYPSLHDDYYRTKMKGNTFLPKSLRRNSITLNGSLLVAYRDGLNKSYIYLLYEDRLELILMQQYLLATPRFIMIRETVGFALESYCVSNSLPYFGMASEFMRRLQEHGVNKKMKADTFRELIRQGIYTLMRDDGTQSKAFNLDYYLFAFGLWSVGLLLSLVAFSMELVNYRC
ncbi:uncharacterized protein LOC108107199 [Drosophila eugracilis]|uniref:uncharacterized protein LOC108107199 n=1 Tax=Drosophila eugracilis TaxID=29029 RepID=UPI001BDA0344|nr:uncharacterized protein LOC108107199 [Drosophila eugracilis]